MSTSYGLKGIEKNMPKLEYSFKSLNDAQIDFGRAVHNDIERELRRIRRSRAWASFCLGMATGMIITYLILKLC